VVLVVLFVVALVALPSLAQHDERRVKAALIYNITRFVEWPESSFVDRRAPLVIAVAGSERTVEIVAKTVDGRQVHGRPLEVRRVSASADAIGAHVVYLAVPHDDLASTLLEQLAARSVLIVADDPESCREAAPFCFFREQLRVRIAVNEEAVESSDLAISSQLLKLARPVAQVGGE
jgi:hypothetical protein